MSLELDIERLNWGEDLSTRWANLGYWQSATTYPQACAALADQVAAAAHLQAADHVLDVGFGAGQQLIHWHTHYGISRLAGIEITPAHYQQAVALMQPNASHLTADLHLGSATDLARWQPASFDKILALDCAYHFETRQQFFEAAQRVLKPGGTLALADITLINDLPIVPRLLFNLLSGSLLIPRANLITLAQYKDQLQQAGFRQIEIRCIEAQVFPGYARFITAHARRYRHELPGSGWRKLVGAGQFFRLVGRWLHYVIVTAAAK